MAFVKGQSGNPSGRPKKDPEMTALAKAVGPQAIARLIELMNQTEDGKLAKSAADSLLDRGYGKPVQQIEQKLDIAAMGAEELTDAQLASVIVDAATPDG